MKDATVILLLGLAFTHVVKNFYIGMKVKISE